MRWVFLGLSVLMTGLAAIDFHYGDWRAGLLPLAGAAMSLFSAWRRSSNKEKV